MNELTVERSSVIIAAEINSIKDQTKKMVLHNSIEIGRRLSEAKEVVPHGEWGGWLEKSVDYSQSTANNLMKIYEEYGGEQEGLFGGNANSETIASLPYTKALALLSIPNYEREEFVEENNVHDISTRKLQQVIKEKKELAEKLKLFKEEAEEHEQLNKQMDTYKTNIKILEEKLERAEENSDEVVIHELNEDIKELNIDLKDAESEIKKLEADLKAKPIEATQIIEKTPEAVEQELEELRKKVKNNSSDESEVKFRYQFEALVEHFKLLLESLENIQDQETSKKYKNAVEGLANQMISNL